ncbi:MAG: transposase [Cyanobacteria bacterium P01_F01_bin.143]
MRQVERHIVKENSRFWKEIDRLCFLSKNLYNYANYLVRQSFIFDHVYLGYDKVYHLVKEHPDYQALPRKVSQQVLRVLAQNWKSFFEASKAYKEIPSKFTGRPKLPKYKHKTQGRNLLIYTIQSISKPWLKKGIVKLSGTDIAVPTKAQNIAQARIIPKVGQYVIEVVYEKAEAQTLNSSEAIAAIDIGVNNLATLTSNQQGFVPILVNGRPLKSLNQFHNKIKAKLQSQLPNKQQTSKRIKKLSAKRNNRISSYLHQASRWIINHLDEYGIGQLIIGKNPLWKHEINNGKKNNQSFVLIPHKRFVEMLIYKAKLKGIKVVLTEESYTSKASFLTLDPIPTYGSDEAKNVKFSGYRETRGIYKIRGENTRINADVNGSYNIMRKVIPTIFDGGIEGVVVRPIRVTPG